MLVLPLCEQFCPDALPVQPAERLGEGADGEVFAIVGEPDKVLKLVVFYDYDSVLDIHFKRIEKALDYLMQAQPRGYARVYEHGYLGTFSRELADWRAGKQDFILYYYTMERLQKTTEDERKVFHSILSHEDRGIKKDFSAKEIRKMLRGLSQGLDFDAKKVTLFCENIRRAPIEHLDIHVRNIMKDKKGNFKLIDLDRIELEKKND